MTRYPLPPGVRLRRAFHVRGDARRRYGLQGEVVDLRGRVLVADPAASERVAARVNEVREARRFPESGVSGAEVFAAGLLDEAVHLMLDAYRRERDPAWLASVESRLVDALGQERLDRARLSFVEAFPTAEVAAGEVGPEAWLSGTQEDVPNRLVALEERLAVRLANENPALERLRDLIDDGDVSDDDAACAASLEEAVQGLPGPGGDEATGEDLLSVLRAPMQTSPTSLEGQLGYVRDHWGRWLGVAFEGLLRRITQGEDLLAERRERGTPGPPGPAPVFRSEEIDEAPVAFSPDADWMGTLVLVAKNAYVWLDQLSRRTGRDIGRLDEVPDEALAELARRGFSGLWLIGLWQRSEASARIKRRRGQADAVASAYALYDYRVSDDLGGEEAWRALRDAAQRHGIRLAADMVPNHVGVDARWVAEHPEWFLSLPEPPYPGYRFTGPDLSDDPRMEVRIEDGYWDGSDAAVVFERADTASGQRRYVYHGNDGTSMPWNDTAQLDYLKPEVREAVTQTVLEVARRFPIIRFDAAMTLAKRHVRRLWYPPPGGGGAIPSRSAYGAMDDEAFERSMPREFWREVVDRVAAEAPDTLLLAEAFWMMEGYFVRSLGMHRVYNSAFMNMLAREANESYQTHLRKVLTFDPQILGRFVNFMNNPDEETAVEQFGDGDKAFGVTALMATLPGLPMFGHGQVEGLREKYGMEYRRAKLDESPREEMVARHLREIAPLLARREAFAGTTHFRLFEVEGAHGPLPDVFAYANRAPGGPAHLVLYHNRYAEARGRVRRSVPFVRPGGQEEVTETLGEALGLQGGPDRFVRYRAHPTGREHLARADHWLHDGMEVALDAYQHRVLLDVQEVRDTDGRWARLWDRIGDRGVPSLEEALRDMELAPVHRAFLAWVRQDEAFSAEVGRAVADRADAVPPAALDAAEAFARALAQREDPPAFSAAAAFRSSARVGRGDAPPGSAWRRAWAIASGFEAPRAAVRALRLDRVLRDELATATWVGPQAWATLWLRTLPGAGRAAAVAPRRLDRTEVAAALRALGEDRSLQEVLGVHEYGGTRWFRREGYRAWAAAWLSARALEGATTPRIVAWADALVEAETQSAYRFDALLAPASFETERRDPDGSGV
ncbi:MAG: alpha-amylase family glycosyl hydrolase [Trueperaceae bacterium]|nr:alpha-amylase family glycosyl hydrolase [Trueperaceae bacterium]